MATRKITSPKSAAPMRTFRHVSRIAPACRAKVAGFGPLSYDVALEGLLGLLSKPKAHRALPR